MTRKWLFRFEVAILATMQFCILIHSSIGSAVAIGQSTARVEQDRKFEDFLDQFETTERTTRRPPEYEPLSADIAGYRVIKTTNPNLIISQADQALRTECAEWRGRIEPVKDPALMLKDYREYRGERTPDPFFGYKPVICVDRAGQSLGTLMTSKLGPSRNGDGWATLILLSRKGTTDMLLAYYNGEKHRAELAAQKDRDLINGRNKMKIGDATHCGWVIDVRGPMVQVASGSRTAWTRRDELYPVSWNEFCYLR